MWEIIAKSFTPRCGSESYSLLRKMPKTAPQTAAPGGKTYSFSMEDMDKFAEGGYTPEQFLSRAKPRA